MFALCTLPLSLSVGRICRRAYWSDAAKGTKVKNRARDPFELRAFSRTCTISCFWTKLYKNYYFDNYLVYTHEKGKRFLRYENYLCLNSFFSFFKIWFPNFISIWCTHTKKFKLIFLASLEYFPPDLRTTLIYICHSVYTLNLWQKICCW